MDGGGETGWTEANQAYLSRALVALKRTLRGEGAPPPTPPEPVLTRQPPALERIAGAFGLSSFERTVLLLCAGIELDPELAHLCAAAQNDPAKPYPCFALTLATLPGAHWSALGPLAPLRRWRLIELEQGQPLTSSPLRIDETVLHCLAGRAELDRRLAATLLTLPMLSLDALAPSHEAVAQQLAATWEAAGQGEATPLVQLAGDGAECRPIVAAAAASLGLRAAVLTVDRVPHGAEDQEDLVRRWGREVCLSGFGVLMLERDDAPPGEDGRGAAQPLARLLERLPGAVVLCERERSPVGQRPVVALDVLPLPAGEQREAWRAALGRTLPAPQADAIADALAGQFSLGRAAIASVAAEAAARAARFGQAPDAIGASAWALCRARVRTRLDGLAQRIDQRSQWDDLILPAAEMAALRAIAAQLRHRITVYERWGFAAKSARGLGISALFAGSSGTGKTMAAEVLASAMALDLYRIDLASVVSKYIGETEKNLRRVFDAAEQSGAILLFDEADALFGKRSEVKDSHDRYANIEVSYLLQRMEAYRGLAVLTSNMKTALDPAFLRRLRFVVQFPFPDAAQRAEIWRRSIPAAAPSEALDLERLAQLRVAGGNIRSIALNAAFLAAEAGQRLGMPHLLAAARSEYAKLERQLTIAESEALTGAPA